ncbi:MAG: 6-bladed beta-propeller [Gemmatimonadota bacterium]|nr:6-bladed beta-propeller [Gemmatimonadota bacterium]
MPRMLPRARWLVPLVVLACAPSGDSRREVTAVRETLPGGGVSVRYADLPDSTDHLVEDLRIGSLAGDDAYMFGDVRGVDATRDGSIYVLDFQAAEIRVFDSGGVFVRTLASGGEGPGEITAANGFQVVGDSVLWVQDHGKGRMLALGLDGVERTRRPMHVMSYRYVWAGFVDDRGVFWKPASHSDDQRGHPPEEGVNQGSGRLYLKSDDPATERMDSVYLGTYTGRTFIARNSQGGYTYYPIPFDPMASSAVTPAGEAWVTSGERYTVTRLAADGDTLMVLEVETAPDPVTDADRAAYVAWMADRDPGLRVTAEEIAAVAPETRPLIDGLLVDDRARLWVRRAAGQDEPQRFDVFENDGSWVTSVTLPPGVSRYAPLRVRDGRMYTVVRDEMDVPFVVRMEVGDRGR